MIYFFAAAFFGAAFLAGAFFSVGALVLVTRPDLVLPVTVAGFSAATAGAGAADFLALPVLALVAVFFGAAALVTVAFLAVAVFLGAAALVWSVVSNARLGATRGTHSLGLGGSLGLCGLWGRLGGSSGRRGLGALRSRLAKLHGAGRTLGAGEETGLGSLCQSGIEASGELVVADVAKVVVGLDVLLQSLTAARGVSGIAQVGDDNKVGLSWIFFNSPRTITLFELNHIPRQQES